MKIEHSVSASLVLTYFANSGIQLCLTYRFVNRKIIYFSKPNQHPYLHTQTYLVVEINGSLSECGMSPHILIHYCITLLAVWFCVDDSHRKWRSKLKQMKRKKCRQLEAQQRDEQLTGVPGHVDGMFIRQSHT